MAIPKELPPEVPGVVGTVASVESLRPNASISIKAGGSFNRWMETLVDCDNVIEECEDGRPAIIGQINRLYLTGWGNQEALKQEYLGVLVYLKIFLQWICLIALEFVKHINIDFGLTTVRKKRMLVQLVFLLLGFSGSLFKKRLFDSKFGFRVKK